MRTAVHHLIAQQARTNPEAGALTENGKTWTYSQLWEAVRSGAAQLQGLGLRRGDRVAVYLEKRRETVAALFAIAAAGGMFVPINPVLRSAQVLHVLADSGAGILVTSPERLRSLRTSLGESDVDRVLVVEADVDRGSQSAGTAPEAIAWGTEDSSMYAEPTVVDGDPVAILYTSGSTGRPKGVVLSHRNLIAGAESVSSYLENTAEDVILALLPLSFDAGLSQLTTAFAVGARCVLMNYLLPRDVPRMVAAEGITGLTCVAPLWNQLSSIPWPEESTRTMRYWANTGGRMPRTTLDSLRRHFPAAAPYLMYGLTEAFRSTYLDPAEVDHRPDSIGKAVPDAEILVLRPDGTPCEAGEEGELVHRGAFVALGYWRDPARTAQRFRMLTFEGQEWRAPERAVFSGDTVVADEEGYLYFVGRSDDMIKTSGYRVSPTELEEAALGTGLVAEVVALGVADEDLGERIVLAVVAGGEDFEPDGLTRALRRVLPAFQVPSRVVVWPDLPRSPNGKYDRAAIKREVSV